MAAPNEGGSKRRGTARSQGVLGADGFDMIDLNLAKFGDFMKATTRTTARRRSRWSWRSRGGASAAAEPAACVATLK
jgi:hypothetical protein